MPFEEIHRLSSFRDRPFSRLAVIGMHVVALGIAGCGRKGPLDPPPGASLDGVPQANMPDLMSSTGRPAPASIGGTEKDGYTGVGADGQPLAPTGPQKRIPLDVLLN